MRLRILCDRHLLLWLRICGRRLLFTLLIRLRICGHRHIFMWLFLVLHSCGHLFMGLLNLRLHIRGRKLQQLTQGQARRLEFLKRRQLGLFQRRLDEGDPAGVRSLSREASEVHSPFNALYLPQHSATRKTILLRRRHILTLAHDQSIFADHLPERGAAVRPHLRRNFFEDCLRLGWLGENVAVCMIEDHRPLVQLVKVPTIFRIVVSPVLLSVAEHRRMTQRSLEQSEVTPVAHWHGAEEYGQFPRYRLAPLSQEACDYMDESRTCGKS
mmetsp:Transcript_3255/g.6980  ORF Transcript_3255/g.6980 Transcript_3255/m.6980 type:complete len:270 (+) Transcript_3255:770-1579(+)